MVEDLVKELGGFEPATEFHRYGGDGGLEDIDQPPSRRVSLRDGAAGGGLELGPVTRDIPEQPARLVLLDLEPGQRLERADMVPRLDHAGLKAEMVFAALRTHLDLLDIEAEAVEALQPLLDAIPLVGCKRDLANQL